MFCAQEQKESEDVQRVAWLIEKTQNVVFLLKKICQTAFC